jgi:hypothetical protein
MRRDAGSVQLLTRRGERPSVAHDATAPAKGGGGSSVGRWKTSPS